MSYASVRIGDFCQTGSGGTPSRSNPAYYEGDIPWVKSGELRESVVTSASEYITEEAILRSSAKIVERGSILLAMYGATVGRMALLGIDAATNQAVCNITPNPDKAFTKYVYYALLRKVPQFLVQAKGGAQPNISQGMIKDTEIPLPPLPEQKRIAAILDKADAIRRKRQQAIELADQFLRSVFLDLIGDPVTNPKRWDATQLVNLSKGSMQNGAYYPKEQYSPDGIEMVHMADAFYDIVQRGEMKRVKASREDVQKYGLTSDDLLISRRSLNYEGAAKPSLVPISDEPLIFESSMIRFTPDSAKVNKLYLFHYLSNPSVKNHFIRKFVTGATIKGINQKNLEQVRVLVPPMETQNAFVHRLKAIEETKSKSLRYMGLANSFFGSLTQKAFAGEL